MALTQGRNLFAEGRGTQLQELLLMKFNDPVAGIIGCHLLLRAMVVDRLSSASTDLYDKAVVNLRQLLGSNHPDVEALSLKCANETLRASQPFSAPPMFSYSWQLVTEASYDQPDLVPIELWERVHAASACGPFFMWAVDEKTKAAHAKQLSAWIGQFRGSRRRSATPSSPPKAAREAGRQIQVPAAATTALWNDRADSQ
jgi:hypothetical protein